MIWKFLKKRETITISLEEYNRLKEAERILDGLIKLNSTEYCQEEGCDNKVNGPGCYCEEHD